MSRSEERHARLKFELFKILRDKLVKAGIINKACPRENTDKDNVKDKR